MTILRSKNGQKWAIGGPPIELVKFPSPGYLFELITKTNTVVIA